MRIFKFLALLFAVVNSSFGWSTKKCKEKFDLALVIQVPSQGDEAGIIVQFLKNTKQRLVEKNPCVRMAVVLAAEEPHMVINLFCGYSSRGRCFRKGIITLRKLLKKPSNRESRFTDFQKAADFLPENVFITKFGRRLNATRRAIFLLTAAENRTMVTPKDAVKDLHDVGISIAAVGAGEGQLNNLHAISLWVNGTKQFPSFWSLRMKHIAQTFVRFAIQESGALSLPEHPIKSPLAQGLLGSPDGPLAQGLLGSPDGLVFGDSQLERCNLVTDIYFIADSSRSMIYDFVLQKRFIATVATNFDLSENGSRAGVIMFSSYYDSYVPITMGAYKSLRNFKEAVSRLHFTGQSGSRIDRGLDLASKYFSRLKAKESRKVRKVAILITDGKQFPQKDTASGKFIDVPAYAAPLHAMDVIVFAVGVAGRTNETQLELITRNKSQVYHVESFQKLVSLDTIKHISRDLCYAKPAEKNKTVPITQRGTTPTMKTSPCNGSRSGCCPKAPIYVNIFNGGQNTIIQGLTFTLGEKSQDKNKTGSIINFKTGINNNLANLLTMLFNDREDVRRIMNKLVSQTNVPPIPDSSRARGIPSPQKTSIKRRSIIEVTSEQRMATALNRDNIPLATLAKISGWERFFNVFRNTIEDTLKQYNEINLALLVTPDETLEKMESHNLDYTEKLLSQGLNQYIVTPMDRYWTYLRPHKGNTIFRSYFDISSRHQDFLTIENCKVLGKPLKGKNVTIFIMNDILNPAKWSLRETLEQTPTLSIFTTWLKKSGVLEKLNTHTAPSQFCFNEKSCIDYDDNAKKRLRTIASLGQFTVFAPSNKAIKKLPKKYIKALMNNREALKQTLLSHILFGTIFSKSVNAKTKSISPSLAKGNIVYMVSRKEASRLVYSDILFQKTAEIVRPDIRATNAVIHVVDAVFIAN